MNNYNTQMGRFNEFYLAAAWNGAVNTVYGFGRDALAPPDANYLKSGHPFGGGTTRSATTTAPTTAARSRRAPTRTCSASTT